MRTLILSLGFLLYAGAAFGQAAGYIGIYSDSTGYIDCQLTDYSAGIKTVYVVHKLTPGVTASQFRVEASGGVTMTYLWETSHVPMTVGDSQIGACLYYASCMPSPILLMAISYFATGTSATCSELHVVPYPGLSSVLAVDCSGTVWQVGGGVVYVNGNVTCDCNLYESPEVGVGERLSGITALDCSVPVEKQSWGRVKALYE